MSLENYRYMFGGPVGLDQPLQDIVLDEFSGAVFKCKIRASSEQSLTCEWYKDGKIIVPSSKFIISRDGNWHHLKITTTTVHDQGVYIVIIKHSFGEVFSMGNLYVNHIKKNHFNTDFLCLQPMDKNLEVVQHLRYTTILVGQTIELEAKFNYKASEDMMWYKSNHLLVCNERMFILSDGKETTLSILRAKETDSGIYHVISKSEYGIASSFASVVVINTDINTLNTCKNLPNILEHLPEELEVNEGEDVRLTCKATYDINTIVKWTKNGSLLSDNNNLSIGFHNNSYISLRIRNFCNDDKGEYCLIIWDAITGQKNESTCILSICDNISMENQCSVQIKKPLEPTVTCFGARIAFNCSFAIDDPIFYYVVWHIGHFRVERTNHKFHMMQSGGEFYIVIKQVEPGMADKVVCELRRALPNRKSIFIASTSTTLTIVPPSMIDKESKYSKTITRRNIFYNINLKLEIPVRNRNLKKDGTHRCTVSSSGEKNTGEKFMIITYCRLDAVNYYLSVLNNDDDLIVERLSVYEKSARGQSSTESSNIVVIEWYDTVPAGVTGKRWYCIDLAYTDDNFVEAGVSSFKMFEIKNPPIEQIMKFRIKATYPLLFSQESKVCIPVLEEKISNKKCSLRPMEEFEAMFTKTGETIGCGAFGSVVLIHDNNGVSYAAKILKTRTEKKRNYAVREYEVMKNLQHPKLVKLYDAFTSRDSFILVMDYFWGGELFDRIVEEECVKEVDVVFYVRQICEALVYLHERNIVHLDLKPENIVCLSPNSRQVKIIDFGIARVLEANHVTRAIYGTRDYVAPEVLNFEAITVECDMWSLGVLTYMLLSGLMPFSGTNWVERSAKITMASYNYNEAVFQGISDLAKDFINHLLVLQPAQRMKSSEALHHQWIVEGPPDGNAGHMKKAQENLKSYLANNKARWQRVANVMIAAQRLRTNVEGQRKDKPPDA